MVMYEVGDWVCEVMRGAELGRIGGEMVSTYRFNTVNIGLKSINVFHKRVISKGYSFHLELAISLQP